MKTKFRRGSLVSQYTHSARGNWECHSAPIQYIYSPPEKFIRLFLINYCNEQDKAGQGSILLINEAALLVAALRRKVVVLFFSLPSKQIFPTEK